MVLVLVMLLSLAMPAFAVNTDTTPNQNPHTITIDNAQESHTYEAYQIFRGDIQELPTENGTKTVLTNITWGSGVDAAKTEALVAALKADAVIGTDMTSADYENLSAAEAVAYVVASFGENSEKLDAFAEVVGDYLSTTKATNNVNYNQINVTGDGYYLLKDQDGSVSGNDAYTKYILKVTKDMTVSAKMATPTLDKTLSDGTTETSGSVGQIVEFKLTSNVPEMDGYNKYFFIVHDTMDAGLTYNNDLAIKISNADGTGTKTLKADIYDENEGTTYLKDYVLHVSEDGQTLEIIFRNFIQYKTSYPGGIITITYSATVDEDVDMTAVGNKNTAHLEFSNNPNYDYKGTPANPDDPDDPDGDPDDPGPGEPTGETPKSVVTVYATGIKLTKINDKTGVDQKTLTGAKFSISGGSHTAYMINSEIYVKDNANGTYYRLKDGTYTTTAPTDDTTDSYDGTDKYVRVQEVNEGTADENGLTAEGWVDSNGNITFTGLGAGTYTITELIAPAGYNLLKEPIVLKIDFAMDEENKVPVWTITKDGTVLTADEVTMENNCVSFDVVNKAGATLPATGGIGTTIFYVAGAILVLVSVVLLVTKKRMNAEA